MRIDKLVIGSKGGVSFTLTPESPNESDQLKSIRAAMDSAKEETSFIIPAGMSTITMEMRGYRAVGSPLDLISATYGLRPSRDISR